MFVDPLNPFDRRRKGLTPVGLKNIGNTCWFSAVIQVCVCVCVVCGVWCVCVCATLVGQYSNLLHADCGPTEGGPTEGRPSKKFFSTHSAQNC